MRTCSPLRLVCLSLVHSSSPGPAVLTAKSRIAVAQARDRTAKQVRTVPARARPFPTPRIPLLFFLCLMYLYRRPHVGPLRTLHPTKPPREAPPVCPIYPHPPLQLAGRNCHTLPRKRRKKCAYCFGPVCTVSRGTSSPQAGFTLVRAEDVVACAAAVQRQSLFANQPLSLPPRGLAAAQRQLL